MNSIWEHFLLPLLILISWARRIRRREETVSRTFIFADAKIEWIGYITSFDSCWLLNYACWVFCSDQLNLNQFLPPSNSSCFYLLRGFCQEAVRRRMWQINFYHHDPMSKSLIQILISSPKCIWERGSLSPEIISLPKPSTWLPTLGQKGVGRGPGGS